MFIAPIERMAKSVIVHSGPLSASSATLSSFRTPRPYSPSAAFRTRAASSRPVRPVHFPPALNRKTSRSGRAAATPLKRSFRVSGGESFMLCGLRLDSDVNVAYPRRKYKSASVADRVLRQVFVRGMVLLRKEFLGCRAGAATESRPYRVFHCCGRRQQQRCETVRPPAPNAGTDV